MPLFSHFIVLLSFCRHYTLFSGSILFVIYYILLTFFVFHLLSTPLCLFIIIWKEHFCEAFYCLLEKKPWSLSILLSYGTSTCYQCSTTYCDECSATVLRLSIWWLIICEFFFEIFFRLIDYGEMFVRCFIDNLRFGFCTLRSLCVLFSAQLHTLCRAVLIWIYLLALDCCCCCTSLCTSKNILCTFL